MVETSSSTSSFSFGKSLHALLAMAITVFGLNLILGWTAPYFDSNFILMDDINASPWSEGSDILLLGDSRTHQGIIPALLSQDLASSGINATAINLARPGQQLPFMYFISKKVANVARHKPKAVVLNASFYLLGGEQWMRDIYISYYQPNFTEIWSACFTRLLTCREAAEWFIRTRWAPWTFRSRINTMIRKGFENPSALGNELTSIQEQREEMRFAVAQGYMNRGNEHIQPTDVPTPHGYTTGIENGYSVYLGYLDQMAEELTAQGIEVFIYQFPWPEQRQNEEGFQEILAYYDQVLQARGNGRIHFLPTYRFWPTEYFIDPLHLNHLGAERLTAELADELLKDPAFQALFGAEQ